MITIETLSDIDIENLRNLLQASSSPTPEDTQLILYCDFLLGVPTWSGVKRAAALAAVVAAINQKAATPAPVTP